MSSTNFDPRNYLIYYEQAIQSKDFMSVFSEYLKERHGDEIIRFMKRVESYSREYHDSDMDFNQITSPTSPTLSVNASFSNNVNTKQQQRNERQLRRSIKNLVLKARDIIDEFIELEASSELNLGATVQSKTLEKWDSILTSFNNYLKDNGRISEMIRHGDDSDTLSSGSGKDLASVQSPDSLTISSGSLNSHSTASNSGSSSPSNSGSGGSGNFDAAHQDKSALGISTLTTISIQLDPEEFFGQAMLMASVDLKMSHFQSFSKSEHLMKFLKEKGEKYTRTIGVDISKGYNVDLRFKPQDLKLPTITDDYIYFGLGLCEETPDWELITKDSKLNYQVYSSKTSYLFDNCSKGMKLSKIVLDLEYPIEDLWAVFCHTENQMEFDPMSYKDHVFHGYVPPNSDPKHPCPFGLQKISCNFDVKLPMAKKRSMKMVGTTIHDSGTDMIMVVKHACDYESSQTSATDEFSKNSINVDTLLSYYVMFRCGEFKNSTRLYHIMYTDLQLPLQEFTLGKLMTKRAKMLSRGMNKILENLTYRGKISVDTSCIVDHFGYSIAARDNIGIHQGRSWYNEWFEKKKVELDSPESPPSTTIF